MSCSLALDNHRIVTNPMEPRGVVGLYDPASGRYTAYVSAQSIHATRDHAARALGVEPGQVRFIAPDVGGGFGAKNFVYPEHVLMPWAAKRVGRPVKWIASRSEVFLADHQGRGHHAEAALALDAEGRFLALRIASNANLGAYLSGSGGGVQTFQYAFLPGTVYRIPAIALGSPGCSPTPRRIGVLRGPGYAEMVNIIERLIDRAAAETGIDRAELRRRNLVPAAAMPADQRLRQQHRQRRLSRNLRAGLGRRRYRRLCRATARERSARQAARARLRLSHQGDRRRAVGECRYPLRDGRHRVADHRHADDRPGARDDVSADPRRAARRRRTSASASCRATPISIPIGGGHGSSRATYMGGTAIWRAADIIIEKGQRIAADALEAAEADIRFENGDFVVAGTDRRIALLRRGARSRAMPARRSTPITPGPASG